MRMSVRLLIATWPGHRNSLARSRERLIPEHGHARFDRSIVNRRTTTCGAYWRAGGLGPHDRGNYRVRKRDTWALDRSGNELCLLFRAHLRAPSFYVTAVPRHSPSCLTECAAFLMKMMLSLAHSRYNFPLRNVFAGYTLNFEREKEGDRGDGVGVMNQF